MSPFLNGGGRIRSAGTDGSSLDDSLCITANEGRAHIQAAQAHGTGELGVHRPRQGRDFGGSDRHLAIALGVEATRRRLRVYFARAADLVQSLLEARDERRLTALQQRYQRVALLIVDVGHFSRPTAVERVMLFRRQAALSRCR